MRKIKSFLCFLVMILSFLTLSACSLSEISIEDAYTNYVEKVNIESLRSKEYLEADIKEVVSEKVDDSDSEDLYKLTTYSIKVIIQPNKFYVKVKNLSNEYTEEFIFKNEYDSFYKYYKNTTTGVISEKISEGEYLEYKGLTLNMLFPSEKILPTSVDKIEKTEVFISGLTSVKVIFETEVGDACSVSINEGLQINEFIFVSADNTCSTIITYVYPYNWNFTDIPSLI